MSANGRTILHSGSDGQIHLGQNKERSSAIAADGKLAGDQVLSSLASNCGSSIRWTNAAPRLDAAHSEAIIGVEMNVGGNHDLGIQRTRPFHLGTDDFVILARRTSMRVLNDLVPEAHNFEPPKSAPTRRIG